MTLAAVSDEADEAVASHRYRWSGVSTAAASLLVTTVGVAVLIGWWVESQALIQVVELPGSRPMMPLTAVGFVLAGVALGLLRTTAAAASRLARIGTAMAAILVALSILVVVEHLAGSDLGIDRLLFPDAVQRHVRQDPGRPALLTALAFLAAGASLLLLDAPRTWQLVIAQLLALVAGFLGIQGLAGYGYMASASPPAHSELVGLVRMAIHTAAAFVVLAIGILFSRPRRGVVRIVTGSDPGAILARRLLPAAILVPLVLGGPVEVGLLAGDT